ncbi:hypothetical protein VNI00_003614 [Paramarasmius palmivorus]|uniref:GST N-terminal domain-containing protein n=1 Tax=Paramarasmius palmivorus TaxID=297713 RepID=A0AAW0DRG6_9AGAR
MSAQQEIELYDIPSKLPIIAWSPNVWKARYCFNYKKIPYKTIWVEYPDIQSTCKRLGAEPTSTNSDGTPLYTLPIIRDPNTGAVISDSPRIAEYLEANYPDTPTLYPPGTHAFQAAFLDAFEDLHLKVSRFTLPKTLNILNPPSYTFFKEDRERRRGRSILMEDFYPKGQEKEELWKGWKDDWAVVDGWIRKNPSGDFVFGETITWADLVIAGWVIWMRIVFGVDSEEWKDMATWHGGRWSKLLDNLSEYEAIH